MSKANRRAFKIILCLAIGIVIIIGLFIYMLIYESKTDISHEEPYASFLNSPQEVKSVSTIRWNKNNLRFSNYALVVNEASQYNSDEVKSVKHYQPGDYITFHSAKSYYSIHVDKTYYLIATDTLDTGEIIDFEYYYTPSALPFK